MLKFSLHARVTNSMRVSLPKELRRAVEAKRLSQTEVGDAAQRIAPRFEILHDPAYLRIPGEDGFSVLLRENRWPGAADVSALTVLCQDNPFGGPSRAALLGVAAAARASGSRAIWRSSSCRSCGSTSTSGCASSRTSRTRCSSCATAGPSAASCATARATSTARPRTRT